MSEFRNLQKLLMNGIDLVQFISYVIAFFIIIIGMIKSLMSFIIVNINIEPTNDETDVLKKTRTSLVQMSALALSFILGSEILKLFYINNYKQLIIVTGLVIIKLLLHYFLLREMDTTN